MDIIFGTSAETSDFIVDGLTEWWNKNKASYSHIKELVINLDNGPSVSSSRTQFLRRMIEFSRNTELEIHLVYYPPYHSKYNPIERCFGVLERHWNGEILNSIDKALKWASTMAWKGVKATVSLLDKIYEKGISLTKKEMEQYQSQIIRSENLPKWDVRISPQTG
jgi:transposase